MLFSEALKTHIESSSIIDISGIFIENIPNLKDVFPHYLGVISAGDTPNPTIREAHTTIKRIVCSGTAQSSLEKIKEVFTFLIPGDQFQRDPVQGWEVGEYRVIKVDYNQRPRLAANYGNIYIADIVVTFQYIS